MAGITLLLLLATVECLYRAALTRLPSHVDEAAIPQMLARASAAQENLAVLQVRALMPWTLLKVLTAVLRARKRPTSSLERFALANHAARQWLHLIDTQAPHRYRGFEAPLLSGLSARA